MYFKQLFLKWVELLLLSAFQRAGFISGSKQLICQEVAHYNKQVILLGKLINSKS